MRWMLEQWGKQIVIIIIHLPFQVFLFVFFFFAGGADSQTRFPSIWAEPVRANLNVLCVAQVAVYTRVYITQAYAWEFHITFIQRFWQMCNDTWTFLRKKKHNNKKSTWKYIPWFYFLWVGYFPLSLSAFTGQLCLFCFPIGNNWMLFHIHLRSIWTILLLWSLVGVFRASIHFHSFANIAQQNGMIVVWANAAPMPIKASNLIVRVH